MQVIASSYPFGYVLEQVGADAVDVQNLTEPGEEPHALELSPREVADLGEADLVVYEAGFQAAVDEGVAAADLPGDAVIDVAEVADAAVTGFATDAHEHDDEQSRRPPTSTRQTNTRKAPTGTRSTRTYGWTLYACGRSHAPSRRDSSPPIPTTQPPTAATPSPSSATWNGWTGASAPGSATVSGAPS
jgi:hypothetical protein